MIEPLAYRWRLLSDAYAVQDISSEPDGQSNRTAAP